MSNKNNNSLHHNIDAVLLRNLRRMLSRFLFASHLQRVGVDESIAQPVADEPPVRQRESDQDFALRILRQLKDSDMPAGAFKSAQ